MLKLGIIGTNWITHAFVNAAIQSGEYELTAIYSRRKESALTFGEPYGVSLVKTDLEEFVSLSELDVIYLASPNSLHYKQAKLAMKHGKHVISEKPAVSTGAEIRDLIKVADENNVFFFEAARNIHEASFKEVTKLLPKREEILGAHFSFMKYSSRYDAVLAGEEPNIFSTKFSGGAIMDLGIYVVYAAVAWFGKPVSSHYFARKISTGVDGMGTMILRYDTFDVTLMTGKIANSFLPSEIYSNEKTLVLNAVNNIEEVTSIDRKSGESTVVVSHKEERPMMDEARDFAAVITQPEDVAWQKAYRSWLSTAVEVHDVIEALRKDGDIQFAADEK